MATKQFLENRKRQVERFIFEHRDNLKRKHDEGESYQELAEYVVERVYYRHSVLRLQLVQHALEAFKSGFLWGRANV